MVKKKLCTLCNLRIFDFEEFVDCLVEEQCNLAIVEASLLLADNSVNPLRSSNEKLDKEEKRYENLIGKLLIRMMFISFFFWFLNFGLNQVLTKDKLLPTRRAFPALPFFPSRALNVLEDYYDGNGAERSILISKAEIVVVMFYAPWNLDSIEARKVFHIVASAYHSFNSTIKFVAINCHDPRGKCRASFKLYSFPVIFAYLSNSFPVVFNEPIKSHLLFSWIANLRIPMEKILNKNDFDKILSYTDYFVVGYLPVRQNTNNKLISRALKVFYVTAAKSSNLRCSLTFATIQNEVLAKQLGFVQINELQFFSAFSTPNVQKSISSLMILNLTRSNNVIQWVQENINKISAKTVEHFNFEDDENSAKAEFLFRKVNRTTATMVLFTDVFKNYHYTRSHFELKQIAQAFFNCPIKNNKSDEIVEQTKELVPLEYRSLSKYFQNGQQACQLSSKKNIEITECCETILREFSNSFSRKPQSTNLVCKNVFSVIDKKLFEKRCLHFGRKLRLEMHHKKFFAASNATSNETVYQRNNLTIGKDIRLKSLLSWKSRIACKFFNLIRITDPDFIPEILIETSNKDEENSKHWLAQLNGISCQFNRTIGFIVMEKRFSDYFIQKWKTFSNNKFIVNETLDKNNRKDLVVLISTVDERFFWLENVNSANMAKMIIEFVNGNLALKTLSNQDNLAQFMSDSKMLVSFNDHFPDFDSLKKKNLSVLRKINASTFVNAIVNRRNNFDAFVFFSNGPWHGPSQVVFHILHVVANYFKEFDSLIKFFILEVNHTSLPWQYTFQSLPTFLFFPAFSQYESIVFPTSLPLNVPNIMAFLLAQSQTQLRWYVALTACSLSCVERNAQQLNRFLKIIENDIFLLRRSLRRNRHPILRDFFRVLLRRRFIQRRSTHHLQNMTQLLRGSLPKSDLRVGFRQEVLHKLINDSVFLKWLLTNQYGLEY